MTISWKGQWRLTVGLVIWTAWQPTVFWSFKTGLCLTPVFFFVLADAMNGATAFASVLLSLESFSFSLGIFALGLRIGLSTHGMTVPNFRWCVPYFGLIRPKTDSKKPIRLLRVSNEVKVENSHLRVRTGSQNLEMSSVRILSGQNFQNSLSTSSNAIHSKSQKWKCLIWAL